MNVQVTKYYIVAKLSERKVCCFSESRSRSFTLNAVYPRSRYDELFAAIRAGSDEEPK
jgi:hypothetical protein